MKDPAAIKERFLQENMSVRLGELAANLARTKSRCQNDANRDVVKSLIRDSMYFIEWTAPYMDIDLAVELVDLGRTLSRWKLNWENIWSDTTLRIQVASEADSWSQRVLDMSGLLSESTSPTS